MVLVIRGVQEEVLQREVDVRWFVDRLAHMYPDFAAAPVEQRFRWVREGIERATAARLGRDALFQFLCFEQTFQPGCLDEAEFRWARELLVQPGKSPAQSMKDLRHETIRRLLQREAAMEQEAAQAVAVPDEPDDDGVA
jgi:hypothetical protein